MKIPYDFSYPDARALTPEERLRVLWMMQHAFVEIRACCGRGSERAAAIADVFHNIPMLLFTDHFSLSTFRYFLKQYQEELAGACAFDYLQMLDQGLPSSEAPPPRDSNDSGS